VAHLFRDALDGEKKTFDLATAIQTNVGKIGDVKGLDLLASSLDLIDVQEKLPLMNSGRFHAATPVEVLRRALRPIIEDNKYDFVLIDCPPSLGLITLNGLRISDYYIIPTIPDHLSTYGIKQIVDRVGDFSEAVGVGIEPLGILVTKFRAQSSVHTNQLHILQKNKDVPVFDTVIPENSDIAAAAEYKAVSTMRQKWGYRGQFDIYRALTKEVLSRLQVAVAS